MKMFRDGFTIIEILVALLIIGILFTVLSVTLSGSLKMNREAQKEVDTTSRAQSVLEQIQGRWANAGATDYDRACVTGLTLPVGYTAQFVNLSTRGEPISQANVVSPTAPVNKINTTANATTDCTASSNAVLTSGVIPTMRQIIVQSGKGNPQVVGKQDVRLTLNVLRPR